MNGVRVVEGSDAAGMGVVLRLLEATALEAGPVAPLVVNGATGQALDATGAMWSVSSTGAERLTPLGCRCGCVELVEYRDGSEESRFIRSMQ